MIENTSSSNIKEQDTEAPSITSAAIPETPPYADSLPGRRNPSANGGQTADSDRRFSTPARPGIPAGPDSQVQQDIPARPETPAGLNFPAQPNITARPNPPFLPDISVRPNTPVRPGFPVQPNIPARPNPPFLPDISVRPNTPVRPGFPAQPNVPARPNPPFLPDISVRPNTPVRPGFPTRPIIPPAQAYGQVRFLNASTNNFPVTISIDNTNYASNLRFGNVTNYDWISDGFHTVTIRRGTGIRTILLQQTYPFAASERVTMVLTDSGSGIDLVRVSDRRCANLPFNSGCYRFANMSDGRTSYDLMLYGGETVFRNVRPQSVTPYKQAMAGSYQFYVTNSANFPAAREIPIIVLGGPSQNRNLREPLVSFQVNIESGRSYTTYLIGNSWSGYILRALTLAD